MSCFGALYPDTLDEDIESKATSTNPDRTDSGYSRSGCCDGRRRLSHDTIRAQYCLDECDTSMGQPTINQKETTLLASQRNPWIGKKTQEMLDIYNTHVKELRALRRTSTMATANSQKDHDATEKKDLEDRIKAALIPEWPPYQEYLSSPEHFQYIDFKNTARRTANQVYRHSWALEQAKHADWRQRTGSILLYDWNTYPIWRNGQFVREKFGRPRNSLPGESAWQFSKRCSTFDDEGGPEEFVGPRLQGYIDREEKQWARVYMG